MGIGEWIALGSLSITVVLAIIAAIRQRWKDHDGIFKTISSTKTALRADIKNLDDALRMKIDDYYTNVGRLIESLNGKQSAYELYVERHFVSVREYDKDQAALVKSIERMQESLEKRMDDMSKKFDARSPN